MSHDDVFGTPLDPLDPSAYGGVPPEITPLASGDESVLASSGLNARPPGPRNNTRAVRIVLAVVLGVFAIAATVVVFRASGHHKAKPKATRTSAPATSAAPSDTTSATATPTSAPPKPARPKLAPIAGRPEVINKANSGTLGAPYALTLPTGWTIAHAVRSDRTGNLDVRMKNVAKTHSFSVMTIKPAVSTGPLTPAKLAAIKAALVQGEPGATSLPTRTSASVAGASAQSYDITTTSGGTAKTVRTYVWYRAGTTYAASWRVSTPLFAASLRTLAQLLASITPAK